MDLDEPEIEKIEELSSIPYQSPCYQAAECHEKKEIVAEVKPEDKNEKPPMFPSFTNLHNMFWKPDQQPLPNRKREYVQNGLRLRPLLSKHTSLMEKKMKEKKETRFAGQTIHEKIKPATKYQHVKPRFREKPQSSSGKTVLPVINPASNIPELEESKVMQDYKIISHVGKGCFSVVSAAVNKSTNIKCAIKTYARTDQMQEHRIRSIQSQVQNLFDLQHENIISLRHAVRDGRKILLIMENGGKQSLSGLLRKTNNFDEARTKAYFRQIMDGVAYCHHKNICHRDIKLENILVDDNGKVKIIDFGFSMKCKTRSKFTIACGTPPYMSPELAAGQTYSGMSADIWALGVCLYLMLTGKFPFKASNEKQLYRLIQQGKFKSGNLFSAQAKNLLSMMLKTDEQSRASAGDVLKSEWLNTP